MDSSFWLVAVIVFLAFLTQTATGFGAMVISITLSALFFPVETLLTWFTPLVVMLSGYILLRHHEHVAWGLLGKKILPGIAVGMVFGQLLFYKLPTAGLTMALGGIVIFLAARELLLSQNSRNVRLLPWMVGGGIIHGLFASGGPLVVYALNTTDIDKAAFRSTLSLLWGCLAGALIISYWQAGLYNEKSLLAIGWLSACLPPAIMLGELIHSRLNIEMFRKVINVILIFCGLVLVLK